MATLAKPSRLLGLFVFLAVAPAAAAFKYVEVGQKAPDFTLQTLQGDSVQLQGEIGSKALAVVFWATWSPRSAPMLGDVEVLLQERKDKGFRVLAVNVEHEQLSPEERKTIEEMASRWSFPVVIDEDLGTYYRYGVVATPSLALLDDQGVVRYVRASYSTSAKEDIRAAVDALLGLVDEEAVRVAIKTRDYVPPKKATLHFQKAQVLVQRGRARRAIRDLEKSCEIDPKWAEPRVLLARIYRSEARKKPEMMQKAETVLLEAREIQPEHLQTLAMLAEIFVEMGKNEEALQTAEQALALEAMYTPALLAKGRSLRGLGRLDEALAAVEEALEADPRNPEALFEQGEVAATKGDWERAAESFRQAVELALSAQSREG